MKKLLLFSHSGFSDETANGITMKNLLSAWSAEEKAEFYCDVEQPDFSAATDYFRVTDVQMVKAFLFKKSQHIFHGTADSPQQKAAGSIPKKKTAKKIPLFLKKRKYNFGLKWLREYLRSFSPWGHRKLRRWIDEMAPETLCYMVGESIFMDKLVLKVCKKTKKPLVLYNGEAYRVIDLSTRRGLDRAYYRKSEKLYAKLAKQASLVIYNCEMLRRDYETRYPTTAPSMVAYNSADGGLSAYEPGTDVRITYFGNLGVGRSESLLQVADLLGNIGSELRLDIYGNALPEAEERFRAHKNIRYHGFVDAVRLREIMDVSDILLHVESFDEQITKKLKYAFSTKIAQCLCAGRCFVSYAPAGTASSSYLNSVDGAAMVSDAAELETVLRRLVCDSELRCAYARKALAVGNRNHNRERTAAEIREKVGKHCL